MRLKNISTIWQQALQQEELNRQMKAKPPAATQQVGKPNVLVINAKNNFQFQSIDPEH